MEITASTIRSMATMMGMKIPEPEPPSNLVSEFIDKEIDLLLPQNADNGLVDIIKGVYITAVNRDPNAALRTLITVHNDIAELVRALQVAEGPEGEPDLDDSIDESDEIGDG